MRGRIAPQTHKCTTNLACFFIILLTNISYASSTVQAPLGIPNCLCHPSPFPGSRGRRRTPCSPCDHTRRCWSPDTGLTPQFDSCGVKAVAAPGLPSCHPMGHVPISHFADPATTLTSPWGVSHSLASAAAHHRSSHRRDTASSYRWLHRRGHSLDRCRLDQDTRPRGRSRR